MAASTANLRFRRTEAQLQALTGVEREIRASDPNGRRKYLRDFSLAFRNYDSILGREQFLNLIQSADTLLIGDYHALPAAQRFAAALLEQRAQPGDRPVVLGLETVFARDQHILDEWWRREIDEEELRERVRFDLDWGYDWAPFYELLVTAREHTDGIYGLDCMPREDLRKIGARDRHAANKIAEIRQRHSNAALLVLFGESHLAPAHLPHLLREALPEERVLTVLQNIDALYWRAAGERQTQVEAVQVSGNVVCVFNSTPLEKYENYRLHLSRWCRDAGDGPDLAPTLYNLVDSLARFLEIKPCSPHNSTQPKFLVDLLPEIYGPAQGGRWQKRLLRHLNEEEDLITAIARMEQQGCIYLPRLNALYVHDFQMMYAAQEAARFLHHACRGLPERHAVSAHAVEGPDRFYGSVLEHALAYFGSRALYPSRPAVWWRRGSEDEEIERGREKEVNKKEGKELSRANCNAAMEAALGDPEEWNSITEHLGQALGTLLYDLYLSGKISRSSVRHLFLAHLDKVGAARQLCMQIIAKNHRCRRVRAASAGS